jgi:WhiB family redox-sensing transcriptional regulator
VVEHRGDESEERQPMEVTNVLEPIAPEAIEDKEMLEASSNLSLWLMTPDAPELPTLADFIRRPEWMEKAVCRGEASQLFFPRNEGISEEALSYCRRCPVRRECLDHAMAHPGLRGCWGGTSERERIRLRRMVG